MEKHATFAERLKESLAMCNMTKADLSRMTGISKSSLTHYERGDWEGKQDAVYKISRAVKVPESWLMGFGASLTFEELQRSNAARLLRAKVDKNPGMSSGERLFFLMDNSNIPMRELSSFANISEEAVLKWINDNCPPSDMLSIEKVKNFYYLTTTDLFPKNELNGIEEKQPLQPEGLSQQEQAILTAFRALSPEQQEFVLQMLSSLPPSKGSQGSAE